MNMCSWWRSWEIGCFRRKTVHTEEKGRSFEKEQEADWGQNKVCRDLWKPCQPSLSGGVICVCAQLFPQDMTWPGLWTAASRSSSYLPCQEWPRWSGRPGSGGGAGRQRGRGKGKAQDVAFVRCISNNYNPLGLIMCHALCFYLIRIPPRDFGILAPFHGWGAGAQKG